MQKVVIFVNIWYIWNICYICNIWKIKSIVKSEIIVIIQGKVEALHITYNLKHSVPKKVPIVFNNGSNYDYHFIIKELEEKFKKQFICLDGNTEKYITFTVPIEKAVRRIDKNEEETTKNISYCNLLIAQDLWQAHYQILSIIFLKEFVELNVNKNMMIKTWNLGN